MAKILIVDDDTRHLNALWRVFWLDGEHDAERFTDPDEALMRARVQEFDVVISEYGMHGMDGVRFLQAFREIQPHACRILVSCHADHGVFRNALREARVHHILEKPCDGFQLMRAVQEGLEQVSINRELERLRQDLAATRSNYQHLLEIVTARAPEILVYEPAACLLPGE